MTKGTRTHAAFCSDWVYWIASNLEDKVRKRANGTAKPAPAARPVAAHGPKPASFAAKDARLAPKHA